MTKITTPIQFGNFSGTAYYHEHRWWIAPRPLAEFLGLSWSRQHKIILASPGLSVVALRATAADGKKYQTTMLPTVDIGLWLVQVSPKNVRDQSREALIEMQRNLRAAIETQINEAFGIPSPADLEALINAPVPEHQDAAGIIQLRTEILSEPGVARAGQMFAMGLPGTKVGLLLGRSAYWARKQRHKLEALSSLLPRQSRQQVRDANPGQFDMFAGENGNA